MKKYIALIAVVIALGGGAFFTQQWFIGSYAPEHVSASSASDPVSFTATTTSTVLDTMQALMAEGKLSFSGRDFLGLGFFVEEINGAGPADGNYWFLYVNGASSETGASQTHLKTGDVVEWRYKKAK